MGVARFESLRGSTVPMFYFCEMKTKTLWGQITGSFYIILNNIRMYCEGVIVICDFTGPLFLPLLNKQTLHPLTSFFSVSKSLLQNQSND